MKKFSEIEKEALVKGAQTAEASPLFDAFWAEVEAGLLRSTETENLTIEPRVST